MIKHLLIINSDGKERYLCNQAVKPTNEKSVYHVKLITCKNCIKILTKDRL